MHPMIAKAQIAQVQQRKSEGDCPTTPALSVESLEDLVLHYVGGNEGSAAVRDVLAERRRQIEEEGWTHDHDDVHGNGELASAAICYALPWHLRGHLWIKGRKTLRTTSILEEVWPWTRAWWKPKDRRRDLVRAGALIVAEIERFDREAAEQSAKNVGGNVG